MQTVEQPTNRRIQRKRSQTTDNTDKEQTKKPKRSQSQSSSSKSFEASRGHGQTRNKKATKTTKDNDDPVSLISTDHKKKKKSLPTGSVSSSESEGNLPLSDESDSLTLPNSGELCEQSDRKFLQQQIKILKIPFELEKDCPALSRIKGTNHVCEQWQDLINKSNETKKV